MNKQKIREEFEIIMRDNMMVGFSGGDGGGPVERERGRRRKPDPKKSLTNFIVVLAAILGVMLLAYGYGVNSGFTFNNSERPAVECADLPEGGVMCRRPDAN